MVLELYWCCRFGCVYRIGIGPKKASIVQLWCKQAWTVCTVWTVWTHCVHNISNHISSGRQIFRILVICLFITHSQLLLIEQSFIFLQHMSTLSNNVHLGEVGGPNKSSIEHLLNIIQDDRVKHVSLFCFALHISICYCFKKNWTLWSVFWKWKD